MIDGRKERLYPLEKPGAYGCPAYGGTVRKWADHGIISPVTGKLVKLEFMYVGKCRYTSAEAYHRFLKKLNDF